MNIYKHKYLILIIAMLIFLLFPISSFADDTVIDIDERDKTTTSHIDYDGVNEGIAALNSELGIYKSFFIAVSLILSVGILIIHFVRLAMVYDHSLHRRKVIEDIGVTLFVISLMGVGGLIMLFLTSLVM